MSMTGDAAALAVIAALMLGYYWAQWRRAGAANRAARAAVNAAGRQAWRARGVIVLVGAAVFAVIELWLRGRDGDIAVRSHRPSELILIGIIGHGHYVRRPRSVGASVCPRVAVTIP